MFDEDRVSVAERGLVGGDSSPRALAEANGLFVVNIGGVEYLSATQPIERSQASLKDTFLNLLKKYESMEAASLRIDQRSDDRNNECVRDSDNQLGSTMILATDSEDRNFGEDRTPYSGREIEEVEEFEAEIEARSKLLSAGGAYQMWEDIEALKSFRVLSLGGESSDSDNDENNDFRYVLPFEGGAYPEKTPSLGRSPDPRTGIGTNYAKRHSPPSSLRTGIGDMKPNGTYAHLERTLDRGPGNGGIEFSCGSNFKNPVGRPDSPRDVTDADGEHFACTNAICFGKFESSSADGLASFNPNQSGNADIAVHAPTVVNHVIDDGDPGGLDCVRDTTHEQSGALNWNPIERGRGRYESSFDDADYDDDEQDDYGQESDEQDDYGQESDEEDDSGQGDDDSEGEEYPEGEEYSEDDDSEGEGYSDDQDGSDGGSDSDSAEDSAEDSDDDDGAEYWTDDSTGERCEVQFDTTADMKFVETSNGERLYLYDTGEIDHDTTAEYYYDLNNRGAAEEVEGTSVYEEIAEFRE